MPPLPSLFISHGAPDILIEDAPASRFLRDFAGRMPRPRAIVVATAHWTTAEAAVEVGVQPPTIHDFGGFAPELHARHYPAPGDPVLAERIAGLLRGSGMTTAAVTRGFDHGVWIPLALMFPQADIPVVALSVQPRRDGMHHLQLGAALADLRHDGVLIIGSGAVTHNLGAIIPGATTAPEWVSAFDDWAVGRALAGDAAALADWQGQGPHGRRNHPTPEHWLPLLVAMGAGAGAPAQVLHRSTTWGVLRMTALAFGPVA
jgi:4,5-DOPA dioxygenase extradiol